MKIARSIFLFIYICLVSAFKVAAQSTPDFTLTATNAEVCPAPQHVVWTNMSHVYPYEYENLQALPGFNIGAESVQEIVNYGFVEYVVKQGEDKDQYKIIGLSTRNSPNNFNGARYGFYLDGSNLRIREYHVSGLLVGPLQVGQVLRVEVRDKRVRYYVNKNLVFTSDKVQETPFLVAKVLFGTHYRNIDKLRIQTDNNEAVNITASINNAVKYDWYLNGYLYQSSASSSITGNFLPKDSIYCIATGPGNEIYTSGKLIIQAKYPVTTSVSVSAPDNKVCPIPDKAVWNFASNFVTVPAGIVSSYKDGSSGAGAEAAQIITGNGYVEYVLDQATGNNKILGFGKADNIANFNSVKYGYYFMGDRLMALEGGIMIGPLAILQKGMKLRISIDNGQVKYYVNDKMISVSINAPSGEYVAEAVAGIPGSLFENVMVQRTNQGCTSIQVTANSGLPGKYQWYHNTMYSLSENSASINFNNLINHDELKVVFLPDDKCRANSYSSVFPIVSKPVTEVNVSKVKLKSSSTGSCPDPQMVTWDPATTVNATVNGSEIKKVIPNGGWLSGATSTQQIASYGYIEYVQDEVQPNKMIGLAVPNSNPDYTSINYAFQFSNGIFQIWKGKDFLGNMGGYTLGARFKILAQSNKITFYQNDHMVKEVNGPVPFPLVADCSFDKQGSYFKDVKIQTAQAEPVSFSASEQNSATGTYKWSLNNTILAGQSNSIQLTGLKKDDLVKVQFVPSDPALRSSADSVVIKSCAESNVAEVINTEDSGPGSLRQAIITANQYPDLSVIRFRIDSAALKISLLSELENIVYPVIIDGTTQPGYDKNMPGSVVEIADTKALGRGLVFAPTSAGSEIKGLRFTDFSDYGVWIKAENVGMQEVDVK